MLALIDLFPLTWIGMLNRYFLLWTYDGSLTQGWKSLRAVLVVTWKLLKIVAGGMYLNVFRRALSHQHGPKTTQRCGQWYFVLPRNVIPYSSFQYIMSITSIIQGGFFYWSAQFSAPKWKTIGSQSEILFHEILDVQKILVGWTTFFFLALKFGRNS